MSKKTHLAPIHILLADDDKDDRFFFDKALKNIPVHTVLETVEDGEQVMAYLKKKKENFPDVIFLDLNMPRKNGMESITEIKSDDRLKHIPVVIYSTSLHEDIADLLYEKGAHYYVRKADLTELKRVLLQLLTLMKVSK
jgi:CheY-like chemotaxis protein